MKAMTLTASCLPRSWWRRTKVSRVSCWGSMLPLCSFAALLRSWPCPLGAARLIEERSGLLARCPAPVLSLSGRGTAAKRLRNSAAVEASGPHAMALAWFAPSTDDL